MCVDRKMRTTNNYKIIKRRKLYPIDERTSAVDGNTDDVFVFLLKELYVMKQFVLDSAGGILRLYSLLFDCHTDFLQKRNQPFCRSRY